MRSFRPEPTPSGTRRLFLSALFLGMGLVQCPLTAADPAPSLDRKPVPSERATESLLGVYEQRLCEAVSTRWLQLMTQRESVHQAHRVAVSFVLCADGSVTNFSLEHASGDQGLGLLCEKAIADSAPFGHWFTDTRNQFGETRRVRLVFDFDTAGNPFLAFAEQDYPGGIAGSLNEPKVWYLPHQRRLATAEQRPWIGQSPRRTRPPDVASGPAGAWPAGLPPSQVSSLFWPPPEWSEVSGWNSLFFGGLTCPYDAGGFDRGRVDSALRSPRAANSN